MILSIAAQDFEKAKEADLQMAITKDLLWLIHEEFKAAVVGRNK